LHQAPDSATAALLSCTGISKPDLKSHTLHSKVNGCSCGIGEFELASLDDLRARVASGTGAAGRARVQIGTGDVRKMHQAPEYAGALFQVASQFNSLEMVGPSVSPEDGVSRYEHDHTQGPACAMAAGAATIYRNYFVPSLTKSAKRWSASLMALQMSVPS
jgi:hypothetical protein